MKAIVYHRHGPPKVLLPQEVDMPIPKEDEVLIRNYGSSINTADVFYRGGYPKVMPLAIKGVLKLIMRLRKPRRKIPGCGFAGEIVSLGHKVTDWQVGDQVYGYAPKGGACAQYLAVPSSIIAKKPSNLSFLEAAAVPGGAGPALVAFRDVTRPQKGMEVLVIAASGGIGTFGVQIAKHVYGAHVTGVCGPSNQSMVKAIGADAVIDYTKTDYTKGDKKYDIIFDAIGANRFSLCEKILSDEGLYVTVNPVARLGNVFKMKDRRFKGVEADESAAALNLLREWIESGKVKPVIDTVYPLNKTAEAHRHYETGHSKGRVVISID